MLFEFIKSLVKKIKSMGKEDIYSDIKKQYASGKVLTDSNARARGFPELLIIHHSASETFENADPGYVIDIYDSVGYGRGYQKYGYDWLTGYSASQKAYVNHSHPNRDKISFAMAQYALYKKNGEWVVLPLIKDGISNTTGTLGQYKFNLASINIEICGNYLNNFIDNEALETIANYFLPYHKFLKGNGKNGLEIKGHRDLEPTDCPGRILEQLDFLRKFFV